VSVQILKLEGEKNIRWESPEKTNWVYANAVRGRGTAATGKMTRRKYHTRQCQTRRRRGKFLQAAAEEQDQ